MGRLDVLVDAEGVVRVVAALDPGQPVIVPAVGVTDPVLAFVHQEVDVAAARRGGVQVPPVVLRPPGDEPGVGWVGVDADDDAGPAAVAVGKSGRVRGDAAGGAVDRVQVHGRVPGRQLPPYRACTSIAASEICRKKSVFQYHCRPTGYRAPKALCSAVNGTGCSPSSSGVPNVLTGSRISSALACGPA